MATKAVELEKAKNGFGCLGKAADDEPVFILRAQDKLAPYVIEYWVARARAEWEASGSIKGTEIERKFAEAKALAHQMRAWQELNFTKFPD